MDFNVPGAWGSGGLWYPVAGCGLLLHGSRTPTRRLHHGGLESWRPGGLESWSPGVLESWSPRGLEPGDLEARMMRLSMRMLMIDERDED